jgi:nitroreductase
MEFEEVLRGRRSVRHFSEEELTRAQVQEVLDAAAWAPSGGNDQPWAVTALSPPAAAIARDRWELRGWNGLRPKLALVVERIAGRALDGAETQARIDAMLQQECLSQGRPWLLLVHAQHLSIPEAAVARVLASAPPETHELLHRICGPMDAEVARASVYGFVVTLTLAAQARGLASCIQFSYVAFAEEITAAFSLVTPGPIVAALLLGRARPDDPVIARAQARAQRRPVATDFR